MRCPLCKKPAAADGNPDWPFCSERCRLLDLDNWLSGRYRVPSAAETPVNGRFPGSAEGSGAREQAGRPFQMPKHAKGERG